MTCAADRGREAVYAAQEPAIGATGYAEDRPLSDRKAPARVLVDGEC